MTLLSDIKVEAHYVATYYGDGTCMACGTRLEWTDERLCSPCWCAVANIVAPENRTRVQSRIDETTNRNLLLIAGRNTDDAWRCEAIGHRLAALGLKE